MKTLKIENFKKNIYNYLALITCMILFISTFYSESIILKASAVFMICYIILPIEMDICLLLFYNFYITLISINLFAGITLSSLCQIILVLKLFLKIDKISKNIINLLLLIAFQMIPLIFFNQSIQRILVMILNLTLMFILNSFNFSKYKELFKNYYIFGLVTMLIRAIEFYPNFWMNTVYRFTGLWTDANFLGLFCCIGFTFCYQKIRERKLSLIFIPIAIFILYCGYRSYSLTFIFMIIILGIIILGEILVSKINIWLKILVLIGIIIIFILIFKDFLLSIINIRFLEKSDFSHGRNFTLFNALEAWQSNILAVFFGIGYENIANYTSGKASHCTYIDILVQFGLFGMIPLIRLFSKIIKGETIIVKKIFNNQSMHILIFLIYGLTLSLFSFDMMYLLFGITKSLIDFRSRRRYD